MLQEAFPIGENETAGEVHDEMKDIGAGLLVRTVQGLAEGSLTETPQQHTVLASGIEQPLKHAPKIFTDTCKIDWNKPVGEIHNLVRGLSPFPGAFTYVDDKMLKIYRSEKEPSPSMLAAPGSHHTDGKTFLKFAALDGYIHATEIQLEGKKKMNIEDFLRGYRFSA